MGRFPKGSSIAQREVAIMKRSNVSAKTPKNILVIRPDEIGDAVLNTIFLKGLKSLWPKTPITLICRPKLISFYKDCPWIDRVLPLEVKPRRRVLSLIPALLFGFKLRRHHFDTVLLPRYGADYHGAIWMALTCGALRREGFGESVKYWGFLASKILTREWPVRNHHQHEAENLGDALKDLGLSKPNLNLNLWITPLERKQAEMKFRHWKLKGKVVAVGIGAGVKRRQWPVENYADVLNSISVSGLLIGGAEDSVLAKRFLKSSRVKTANACGLSFRQTIALLEQCDVFVGNDSGPMHLAAGVGLPVVEVSAHSRRGDKSHASSPKRFGPWGVPNIIVQPKHPMPPCIDGCDADIPHCILQVKPKEVVAATRRLLSKKMSSK
jgi:ADP-heptose:LPS heptosyltransferase